MTAVSGRVRSGMASRALALALALLLAVPVWADTATTPDTGTVPDTSTVSGTSIAPDTGANVGTGGISVDDSGTIQRPKAQTGDTEAGISLGTAATLPTIGKTKSAAGTLDFAAWEQMASHSEAVLAAANTMDSVGLDRLRRQLTDWRQAFLGAENANAARIETLRQQIAALGPAPAEGVTEPDEIAKRRLELADQLVRLQAPGIAADEAYRRADGLISEIDQLERDRQADELLKLWPSPLNPANWGAGWDAVAKPVAVIWREISLRMSNPAAIQALIHNVPLILLYLAFALGLMWRGRYWLSRLIGVLKGPATPRALRIWDFFVSIALALVPVAGLAMLSHALTETGLLGPVGNIAFGSLGRLGFVAVAAHWIGQRAFPVSGDAVLPVNLTPERDGQARLLVTAFGAVLMLARLRRVVMDAMDLGDAANAVAVFPVLLIAGLMLWRMGRILTAHQGGEDKPGDEGRATYRDRSIAILAQALMAIGIAGPVLAAVGYIAAAQALILPAALSLGLVATLFILQRLIADIWAIAARVDGADQDGLLPVLAGFVLALLALPVLALIWGARLSELTELWARFQVGFTLGQARISPMDFVIFAAVFGAGYTVTRLLKGLIKTTVLPRTRLDPGGQTAVLSGLGYIGIFLSALVAIDSAGIDLSGLAVVAGALSVGIGFGLQQVVSNFVSGVILLIERPVAEGDWIEVGPVQGIVKSISVRSTRIQTFDRSDVIVPNSDLITQRVTNWTKFGLTGRLVVAVSVPFTANSRKVEATLRDIAEAQPLVLLSPPPIIALMSFGPEAMNFEIRVILRDVNFQVDVRSDINHAIAKRFAEEGIAQSNAHRDFRAAQADAPNVEAAADAEQRAQDALLAALMGPEVAARVRAAREGSDGNGQALPPPSPDAQGPDARGPDARGPNAQGPDAQGPDTAARGKATAGPGPQGERPAREED